MKRFVAIALVLAGLLALVACGGGGEVSFSTANIRSAVLASDEDGANPTNEFAPEDTFYLVVDLANAPEETAVKTVWYAVDVGDAAAPNTLIDEASLVSGSAELTFDLTSDNTWPPGAYKVELYLNDELNQTLEFSVAGEVVEAQPEPTEGAEAQPEPTEEPEVAEPADDGAVTSLQGVRDATIRIQAEGSFIDPEFGEMTNAAGQGTGFIIDPSGLAVTNNHVVTGAAFLQVYVEGEDDPFNARILGVSECSDLAVIDIDGGGFPYLNWYEGEPSVGLDIYVAGFPLFGNEEYTLTRGIVSKADADGETDWASVDSVLEIDAIINPGNSGGPLVDSDGRVVGVNYASASGVDQYFSIAAEEALPVIERLIAGEDVNAIGINGQAVTDGESIWGIWVSSVESGSPADNAGIRSGDILTKMEGLVLATDGTFSAYCDILRGHSPGDVLAIEVLRLSTGEILEGQLNGSPLETVSTFGAGTGGTGTGGTGTGGTGGDYSGYTEVTDDTGALQITLPVEWSDLDTDGWTVDGQYVGPGILASTNIDGYLSTWTTPGMFFGASETLAAQYDVRTYLDGFNFADSCVYDGRFDYSDQLYTGSYDLYSNCGGEDSSFLILVVEPATQDALLLLQVQMVSDADQEALQNMLDTFVHFTE